MMVQYYLKPTKFTNAGKDVCVYYGTCDYHIEYNDNSRPTLPIGWLPNITHICGKPLTPPYFIAYDFLCSGKILYSDPCVNSEDEAVQTAKLAEYIKLKIEEDSFSSQKFKDACIQETLHSKERWCQECYDRRKKVEEENLEYNMTTNEKQALEQKEFQLEEYKRQNKPISKRKGTSVSSRGTDIADVERYITSLPDRSNILKKELGYDKSNPDFNPDDSIDLEGYIYNLQTTIWIIFSSDNADVLAQRIENADVLEVNRIDVMLTKNSKPIMFVLYMIESLHIKAIEAVPVTSAQNKDESKRCLDSIK